MSRQYIGARYVPTFSELNGGVHDSQYSYEALTIVKNGNDFYTSRKPVPVGVSISNTEYWVQTGNYNGAITELDERMTEAEENIESLENNHITKTPIILIGDSYGTLNGGPSPVTTALPDVIKQRLSNRMTVYSAFANGSGFANGMFLSNIQSLANTITNKNAVKDIYVMGGFNDEIGRTGVTTGTLTAGMSAFASYCTTNYPKAKLHLMFISWSKNVNPSGRNLQTTFNYYEAIAQAYGFTFHVEASYVLRNSNWMQSDGSHPNDNGVAQLARYISNIILSGHDTVILNLDGADFTASGSASSINIEHFHQVLIDNVATYSFVDDPRFAFSTAISYTPGYTGAQVYEVATWNEHITGAYLGNDAIIKGVAFIQTTDSHVYTIDAYLVLIRNKLYLKLYGRTINDPSIATALSINNVQFMSQGVAVVPVTTYRNET